ncbi:MAG TPA: helical backbone metal receptor [Chitinispirillaceae bacterium]|nr:helical backbone metal receptor [Chitinispirillaceae bacterium]
MKTKYSLYSLLLIPFIIACSNQKQATFTKIPMRIVSLAPSITETLFALGLGERVIGVTSYCNYPPEVKLIEKVGGYSDVNIERIVTLHPDIVILTREHSSQKEALDRFNIRTLTIDHSDFEHICSSFVAIGTACQVMSKSDSLTAVFQKYIQPVPIDNSKRPSVLLCVGREAPGSGSVKSIFAAGVSTIYNQIIEAAGGKNAFRDSVPMYPSLSYEGIMALKPDIIIDAAATMGDFKCDQLVGDWRSLSRVKAVQMNNVFCVQKEYATVPGPRILLLIEDFRKVLQEASKEP